MERTCTTCQYWQTMRKADRDDYADCDNPVGFKYEYTALDDQGLNIYLMTHKDFSCPGYQRKEGDRS